MKWEGLGGALTIGRSKDRPACGVACREGEIGYDICPSVVGAGRPSCKQASVPCYPGALCALGASHAFCPSFYILTTFCIFVFPSLSRSTYVIFASLKILNMS